jgi:hypothetical protein
MHRRPLQHVVACFALAGYLLATLGGSAIVMCKGSDGHQALEWVHGPGTCGADAPEPLPLRSILPTGCEDTAIHAAASAATTQLRGPARELLNVPAALLPMHAWAVNPRAQRLHAARIEPFASPPPFDAIHSVVLLI